MRAIAEKDWKRLRAKQDEKLNQASENIVGRVKAACMVLLHAFLRIWLMRSVLKYGRLIT